MKRYIYWIIAICLSFGVIRFLFFIYAPRYLMTGDSVSYYLTMRKIVTTKKISDQWRTPLYPLIMSVPFTASSHPMPEDIYGIFSSDLHALRVAQSITMIVTSVIMFFLCIELGIPAFVSFVIVFVSMNDIMLIFLEHAILTESFTMFFLVIGLYFGIRLMHEFRTVEFGLFTLSAIMGVMLRPSLLAFAPLMYLLILIRHRTRIVVLHLIVAFLLYLGLIQGFVYLNERQEGYRGVSRISDVNIWGKLLHIGLNLSDIPRTEIGDMAAQTVISKSQDPFEIFREHPVLYSRGYPEKFHGFVMDTAKGKWVSLVRDSIQVLPSVIVSQTDVLVKNGTRVDRLFLLLQSFYNHAYFALWIPCIIFPFAGVLFVRFPSFKNASFVMLSSVGMYTAVIAASMTYGDFSRHMSVGRPFLFLSLWIIFSSGKLLLKRQ